MHSAHSVNPRDLPKIASLTRRLETVQRGLQEVRGRPRPCSEQLLPAAWPAP